MFTLFCCKKSDTDNKPKTSAGSIQYKVNGNLVVIDNVDTSQYVTFCKRIFPPLPNIVYELLAQKSGLNNVIHFIIISGNLEPINYHYDIADVIDPNISFFCGINYNLIPSYVLWEGDYLDINISSYKNSRITGTFTAKLTPSPLNVSDNGWSQRGTTLITEGKLDNVKVID